MVKLAAPEFLGTSVVEIGIKEIPWNPEKEDNDRAEHGVHTSPPASTIITENSLLLGIIV